MDKFDTPILYLMFNRPDLVRLTFPKIKEIKPKYLFIAADGPRKGNIVDETNCQECRDWVLNQIDWECDLKSLFREDNLGCGLAVSEAITWFFEHVEMGIILEDDILPHSSFFLFTQDLLNYYRNDESVVHISGVNFIEEASLYSESYHFSNYTHVWGWATWRSSWQLFDYSDVHNQKFNTKEYIKNVLKSINQAKYWLNIVDALRQNRIDTWDYYWHLSLFLNKKYCITPKINLIENLGFGSDSTHTQSTSCNLISKKISFPLIYSNQVSVNSTLDGVLFNSHYESKTIFKNRLRNLAYLLIPSKMYYFIKKIYYGAVKKINT